MLRLAPERVRSDAAASGNTAPIQRLMPVITAVGVAEVAPNGVLGDPTHATAEHGAALLEAMVDEACRRTVDWDVDERGRLAGRPVPVR
jgi:creatinine amidohydrolase